MSPRAQSLKSDEGETSLPTAPSLQARTSFIPSSAAQSFLLNRDFAGFNTIRTRVRPRRFMLLRGRSYTPYGPTTQMHRATLRQAPPAST